MSVDVAEAFTRKLGPLPVWGWGLAIGGAGLGYKLLKGGGGTTSYAGNPIVPGAGLSDDGLGSGGGGGTGSGDGALDFDFESAFNDLSEQINDSHEAPTPTPTPTPTPNSLIELIAQLRHLMQRLARRKVLLLDAQQHIARLKQRIAATRNPRERRELQSRLEMWKQRRATYNTQITNLQTNRIPAIQRQIISAGG